MTDYGNSTEEQRKIPVSPILLQELILMKCKEAAEMKDWWAPRWTLAGTPEEITVSSQKSTTQIAFTLQDTEQTLREELCLDAWLTTFSILFRNKEKSNETLLDNCLTDVDSMIAKDVSPSPQKCSMI